MNVSALQAAIIAVLALVGIGLYGLLVTRNLIKMIILIQLIVKGAILALVTAGRASGQINLGQSIATTVIVVDTVVAVVALALAIRVKQQMNTLDLSNLATLKK